MEKRREDEKTQQLQRRTKTTAKTKQQQQKNENQAKNAQKSIAARECARSDPMQRLNA